MPTAGLKRLTKSNSARLGEHRVPLSQRRAPCRAGRLPEPRRGSGAPFPALASLALEGTDRPAVDAGIAYVMALGLAVRPLCESVARVCSARIGDEVLAKN